MENKELEKMTVAELKEKCTEYGLPKQKDGKKLTKAELIESIREHTTMKQVEEHELETEEENQTWDAPLLEKNRVDETENKVEPVNENNEGKIIFAKTLEEIEKKYSARKPDFVYENELVVGSLVAYIKYVEAKNTGNIYKKLRTAKVTAINRKKEIVKVETILGEEDTLYFDELLFIRKDTPESYYPADIKCYLRKQRTPKGSELIYEAKRRIEQGH